MLQLDVGKFDRDRGSFGLPVRPASWATSWYSTLAYVEVVNNHEGEFGLDAKIPRRIEKPTPFTVTSEGPCSLPGWGVVSNLSTCDDSPMADERFRGLRLEIATILNGHQRTLYQTARALGRRSGDIQKTLRQMHAEGLLEAEHEEPEPGTRFRLAPTHEEALAEALRADQIPGLVEANQDLFLLRAPNQKALDAVFALGDLTVAISWAARLGDRVSMLVAVAPRASEGDYRRLSRLLEEAGMEVTSFRTATVTEGRALGRAASASAGAVTALAGSLGEVG